MGVFGNSNSLPISLVLSLSQTLKGLHWDKVPGDNDDEVAARGILYLLIFQQLGQLVRWSWGYHVLLAPRDKYPEYQAEIVEEGQYRDEPAGTVEEQVLIDGLDGDTEDDFENGSDSSVYDPAGRTPVIGASRVNLADSAEEVGLPSKKKLSQSPTALSGNHPILNGHHNDIMSFPSIIADEETDQTAEQKGLLARGKHYIHKKVASAKSSTSESLTKFRQGLPKPLQSMLSGLEIVYKKASNFFWEFMNPPLWAMLIAVLVASVPALQKLFFEEDSFVRNSVTSAIKSNGGVAVPLILVVLGANLARNTMAREDESDPEEDQMGNKLLIASLLSRMVLPTLIMAPILALVAKYINVSILDDPIFVIVCFLLTGAPSALQLAQICQINQVYEKTMGRILFQSYVIW